MAVLLDEAGAVKILGQAGATEQLRRVAGPSTRAPARVQSSGPWAQATCGLRGRPMPADPGATDAIWLIVRRHARDAHRHAGHAYGVLAVSHEPATRCGRREEAEPNCSANCRQHRPGAAQAGLEQEKEEARPIPPGQKMEAVGRLAGGLAHTCEPV